MIPAASLVDEKQHHTPKALTTTPATLEEVFLTKGLIGFGVSLFAAVLILSLNQAFSGDTALLILLLALGSILAAGFGVFLGALSPDITSLFATFKAVGLLLYAPAILYLFPQIPDWVGKIFPTYYIIQPVVEVAQRGGAWEDVVFEVMVLIGLTVALIGAVAVAARRVRRQDV